MTEVVWIMIILGVLFIFISFFITERLTKRQENFSADLLTVTDSYEFSERERNIIKRKIEEVIATQAKDILYETNDSLNNMANEKTMALGDYAVTVCEEIERNHKEVMFLYSMLDDKQKEIMNSVNSVNSANAEIKETLLRLKEIIRKVPSIDEKHLNDKENILNENIVSEGNVEKKKDKQKNKNMVFAESVTTNSDVCSDTMADNKSEKTTNDFETEFEEDLLDDVDMDFNENLEKNINSNDIILEMYENGDSIITIAKELGLGVGEVKLVVDLYQGEK